MRSRLGSVVLLHMCTFMGLRSWGDTEGNEFWEDVTKERFLRIFLFWFFVVLWLEGWRVCRRVWSVWLKNQCHSVQEVKPRGTNHRVQEPSCALQAGWSEWCLVPSPSCCTGAPRSHGADALRCGVCDPWGRNHCLQKDLCAMMFCGVFCGVTLCVLAVHSRAPGQSPVSLQGAGEDWSMDGQEQEAAAHNRQ